MCVCVFFFCCTTNIKYMYLKSSNHCNSCWLSLLSADLPMTQLNPSHCRSSSWVAAGLGRTPMSRLGKGNGPCSPWLEKIGKSTWKFWIMIKICRDLSLRIWIGMIQPLIIYYPYVLVVSNFGHNTICIYLYQMLDKIDDDECTAQPWCNAIAT